MGKMFIAVCSEKGCDGHCVSTSPSNYRCLKCGKPWTEKTVSWILNNRMRW